MAEPPLTPEPPAPPTSPPAATTTVGFISKRLASLDAYRGLVMLLMMAEVLHLCRVASARPESGFWKFLCFHQSHVPWIGCSLHDLIQPSFSFVVGVAIPFSIARRLSEGHARSRLFLHAFGRSLILILLGVALRSIGRPMINWTFEDTLTQIGLGYPLLFLLALASTRVRWLSLGILLVGYWVAFAIYPLPPPGFDYTQVGVPANWPHLMDGFQAHWNKNSNLAWAFDVWFLNLFPRVKPFLFNGGGYATLSFIPTLATMLLGLLAGEVMRSAKEPGQKLKWLLGAGVAFLLAGAAFGWLGLCPVVKRIWTPSWTLYSGGWCFLLLAGFYFVLDLRGHKRWAFPLVVIGLNSIAAYLIAHLYDEFGAPVLKRLPLDGLFKLFGEAYQPLVQGLVVLLGFWALLYLLYRRRWFLRI